MRHSPRLRSTGLALVVVLAGCGGQTGTTVAPAGLATPSVGETADAPPDPGSTVGASAVAASPSAGAVQRLALDSIAVVVNGPLRVRSRPSVEGDSKKFDPLLETGQRLFVLDGPVAGSDYSWYLVRPVLERTTHTGWIAAADHDGTPWLAPGSIECDPDPSIDDLRLDEAVQLACYARREFTFTGTLSNEPACDGSMTASPGWLAPWCGTFRLLYDDASDTLPPLEIQIAVPPDTRVAAGFPDEWDRMDATVVAHLDDPAARTCVAYPGIEADAADQVIINQDVILDCRATFVASSVALLPN
jgi:hypothetical protein